MQVQEVDACARPRVHPSRRVGFSPLRRCGRSVLTEGLRLYLKQSLSAAANASGQLWTLFLKPAHIRRLVSMRRSRMAALLEVLRAKVNTVAPTVASVTRRIVHPREWCAACPSRAEVCSWLHARSEDAELHFSKRRRKVLLSHAGPILLVMIFVQDGVDILLHWDEQFHYMTMAMKRRPTVASLCLAVASALQLTCSALILRPRWLGPSRVTPASTALVVFVAVQPLLYGQTADVDSLCRSVTLVGGLLLLLWGENLRRWRATSNGMPLDFQSLNTHRLQLAGRLLLTFVFFFQALWSENGGLHTVIARPTVLGAAFVAALFGLAVFISVGFKTEWSALSLVVFLGVTNVWLNPFWNAPVRLYDLYKYNFFQTLSIMGGLVLLAVHGPGSISFDHNLGHKKRL